MTEIRFDDLDLSDPILSALDDMGYVTPTPVQAAAIPLCATGRDLMVQSQTGTGKTAAFGIPMIESLGVKPQGVRALVLCPTRELARQVAEEFNRLGEAGKVQTVAVYGGASLEKQIAEMRFAHIVVGTPGRVLDHLRRKTLSLKGLRVLCLDEADEMLSMGFARELSMIMDYVPVDRQTLLFSATIPQDVRRYAKRYMREPEFLSLIEENVAADEVEHHYYMVSGVGRTRDLVQVLEYESPDSALIFTNTRKDSELVARYLQRQGYDAEYLNGDLPQREREKIMARAKDKNLRFLVATDVAARGIDISQLSHVINYILPESPEVYIHRTGRTGRAGASGTAISLIGPREIGVFYYLKRIYDVALEERSVPTQAEIEMQREEHRTEQLVQEITDATATLDAPDDAMRAQTMRLLERDDAVEVVQALLQIFRAGGAPQRKAGGVLEDVPKPERIAPGSRAQTVQGIADRVSIVQSEFRGLPGKSGRKAPETKAEAAPEPAVEAAPEAAEAPEAETPKRRRRRRRPEAEAREAQVEAAPEPQPEEVPEPEPEPEPEVEAAAEAEDEDEARPARRRRRRRRDSEAKARPAAEQAEAEPEPEAELDEAPEAEASPTATIDDDAVRLFINLGRRDGLKKSVLRETIAELGGLLPDDFVEVSLRSRHSYLVVLDEFAEDLIAAVDGETFDGKTIRLEHARS